MSSKQAKVVGLVRFRMGDGPMCKVPRGSVEVTLAANDATLSWDAGDSKQSAAIPMHEFNRMVREHAIVMG